MVVNLSYEACVGSADNRPPLSSVSSSYIYMYNFRIVEIYVQDTIKIFPRDESEFRYIFSYDLEKTGIVINNLIISRSMAKGEKDEGWRGGREETKRYSTRFPFARSF